MSNNTQNPLKFQIINLYTHNITFPFRHVRSIPFAAMLDSRQVKVAFEKFNKMLYRYMLGYAVAQLVEALRYKPEGRGFDSGPGVDSASNRNQYQKYFMGWG